MGEENTKHLNPRDKAGRFVLLVHAHAPGPMKLLEGLRKRNAAVRVVPDAPSAMVEIAQFKAQVLIIHQPESMPGLESLLAAVRFYHPAVICWRHEAAGAGRRENLSPFACKLKPAATPRFTQAPQTLKPAPINMYATNASHENSSEDKFASNHINGHNGSAQPQRPHVDSDKTTPFTNKSVTIRPATKSSPTSQPTNGRAKNQPTDPYTSSREASSSLGHRLAVPLDALDDLTAGPLLSAEEIELLRGPAETDDNDRSHFK